jgi:uncharacterized protein (TIGR03032 family)
VRILKHVSGSLLVSTYQAGKLISVGVLDQQISISFHHFDRAMGVAVHPRQIAIGTQEQVWQLQGAPDIAPQLEPRGRRDACYVARQAHHTNDIHIHEMAFCGDTLWFTNTRFSCLATLHDRYSFVPQWRPPFISALAPEDRCHLNGLAIVDDRPRYVTAFAQTDTPQGWRPTKLTSGCVMEVPSGRVVADGLCMPHSPRWHEGQLYVLDSGKGQLVRIDPSRGKATVIATLPGYARGLAMAGSIAFVGLSKIRETAVFGGVPVTAGDAASSSPGGGLKCGVAAVDMTTGQMGALLEFKDGVDEVFDVQLLPALAPVIAGPNHSRDEGPPIWVVPLSPQR